MSNNFVEENFDLTESDKLQIFLEQNKNEFFTYFLNRNINVIRNHVLTLVFKNENEIVSYGHIDYEKEIYWLGIMVCKKYRNQGLGERMLNRLIEECESKKIKRVHLTVHKENASAIRLYIKLKFQICRSFDQKYEMQKILSSDDFIPIYKPYIQNYQTNAIRAIETNWISNHGSFIELANYELRKLVGCKYSILMNNGTSATHCLFLALKYKYPDIKYIYIPNFCYVAAYNCCLMEYDKYQVEILDIDRETLNFKWDELSRLKKNSALLVLHNIGNVINIQRIKDERPDIILIEDNCEGWMGSSNSHITGSHPDILCSSVSFYGNKTFTTGEGGAFLTNDSEIYEYINKVYSQGMSAKRYIHEVHAYNYRMTNIEAAFLYDQLLDYQTILNRKSRIFCNYKMLIAPLIETQKIQIQKVENDCVPAEWMFLIKVISKKYSVEYWLDLFMKFNIEIRPFFYCYCQHKHINDLRCEYDCSKYHDLTNDILLLPSYPDLTLEQQKKIVSILEKNL